MTRSEIARFTGMTERTVEKHLRIAEQAGWLTRIKTGQPGEFLFALHIPGEGPATPAGFRGERGASVEASSERRRKGNRRRTSTERVRLHRKRRHGDRPIGVFSITAPLNELEIRLRAANFLAIGRDNHLALQEGLQRVIDAWLHETRFRQPPRTSVYPDASDSTDDGDA